MPYMARLVVVDKRGDEYDCGGSLIAENIILSAAHCFYGNSGKLTAKKIKVYLRDYSDDKFEDKIMVDGVMAPSAYGKGDNYGDIAVAHLERRVTTTPVSLPNQKTKLKGSLIVAGYGSTEDKDYSDDLLYATVPFLSDEDSQDFISGMNDYDILEDDHFGAGYDDDYQDACAGDSGGPIILPSRKWGKPGRKKISQDIIVGVVSDGYTDCGDKPAVGFYTDIKSWLKWIRKTIKRGKYDAL
eukprot:jgi/Picre1/32512/NNA_007858.t1